MKTQTQFKNASLVSVVNGSIVVKDSTGKEHTFTNASVVSVNNGTIIIESEGKPKNGELIKYTWSGTRYCIFREIITDQLWSYGCSIEKLSEFPYDYNTPKFRPYSKDLNISPVTPKEQKEFDDFCKSQGKIWNKETLQWEKYRWKPVKGQTYYYVALEVIPYISFHIWRDDGVDDQHYQSKNCFKTEEEALVVMEKIKKLLLEV